jgi:type I restriction-modification system DNA methylase subunit
MAEQSRSQAFISAEEVLKTEIIVNQALIDILIAKEIISEAELLKSIQKIRKEQDKMTKKSEKIVSLQKRPLRSRNK